MIDDLNNLWGHKRLIPRTNKFKKKIDCHPSTSISASIGSTETGFCYPSRTSCLSDNPDQY